MKTLTSFEDLKKKLLAVDGVRDVDFAEKTLTVKYAPNKNHDKTTEMQLFVALAVSDSKIDVVFIDYAAVQ